MDCVDWPKLGMWASAVVGVAVILWLIWRTNRGDNSFRVVDLVLEGEPPKASISKLILAVFAALSVWVVIMSVLDNRIDSGVSTLLLGVLGIFVVGRTAQSGIVQFSSKRHEVEGDERPPAKPRRDSVIK